MKSDIIIVGGGASGLMAAYGAARTFVENGNPAQVTVLEKMPRPARKMMITGKGRCNFTNLKEWNDFSTHVRSGQRLVKSAFYNLPSKSVIDFFEDYGLAVNVERGDRAYPSSYKASDVIDTLVNACSRFGVKIITGCGVTAMRILDGGDFALDCSDGSTWRCAKLILATGGLSYPLTGSTGDGYKWAADSGHRIEPLFPSLTALVPEGYKVDDVISFESRWHIDRSTPMSELGDSLHGIQLKNVSVSLVVEGNVADEEFGDIDFTDGGIEGPVGFRMSRKAVKSLRNGSKVSLVVDMKPGVPLEEITARVKELWSGIDRDPRSGHLREKEKCRILLGKLMPWDLIPAFRLSHPEILTLERKSRTETKQWVNLPLIAKTLKEWEFRIVGYVGYERAVVTAGGVSADDVVPKTLESKRVPGMYFCGELLDVDCDTGGYNLQCAFSTGYLAGQSAAKEK